MPAAKKPTSKRAGAKNAPKKAKPAPSRVPKNLTADLVVNRVAGAEPEKIRSAFVEINGVRFPATQVMALATGKSAAHFRSRRALERLERLGFTGGYTDRSRKTGRATRYSAHSGRFVAKEYGTDRRAPDPRPVAAERRAPRTTTRTPAVAASSANRDAVDAALREHVGEWVATRDGQLLVAAPTLKTVLAWLADHDERAESTFKVPRDLSEVSGLAA